jgi:antitoxin MazE
LLSRENAVQVSKWGNSLAVRLPKKLVEAMGLKPGDELAVVELSKGAIAVVKDEGRERALAEIAALNWKLPDDYEFDRDEANSR